MLCSTLNKSEAKSHRLNNFTRKVNQDILEIVSLLNWTVESIETDNDNYLVCPYNASHRIGKKTLNQHLESCLWKEEGYTEFDTPLPSSSLPLDSPTSLKLDTQLQNTILKAAMENGSVSKFENYECHTRHKLHACLGERLIPQTSDRIFANFTSEERKILYEYVVNNTAKIDVGGDITDMQKLKNSAKDDRKLSFLELLVQERNLKRRRAKHRGIHTNKKSHTEILREVINQQMEFYIDCINEMNVASNELQKMDNSRAQIMDKSGGNALSVINRLSSMQKPSSLSHRQPDDRRITPSFRSDQKYESLEKRRTSSSSKDRQKRENSSSSHKRRRSRSRERDYDKRNTHRSIRYCHARDDTNFHDYQKPLDSNSYSRRYVDHRKYR